VSHQDSAYIPALRSRTDDLRTVEVSVHPSSAHQRSRLRFVRARRKKKTAIHPSARSAPNTADENKRKQRKHQAPNTSLVALVVHNHVRYYCNLQLIILITDTPTVPSKKSSIPPCHSILQARIPKEDQGGVVVHVPVPVPVPFLQQSGRRKWGFSC
jgi:hypothetical protein